MKLLLGSQSPRRRELLSGLDIPFECVSIHADESFPPHLQAGDIPLYIAKQKAAAYISRLCDGELLLTADTIVWVDGRMLGKPRDEEDAKAMLHLLSGRTHQVYTGVVLTMGACRHSQPQWYNARKYNGIHDSGHTHCETTQSVFVDCTDVTFRELTDAEIDYYVSHYRPLDKAGAYGVQEYIGYIGVERIVGSYYNVMGLPVERLYLSLRRFSHQLQFTN